MKIAITDIENAKDKKSEINFEGKISGIETEDEVKAKLIFEDLGTSITVKGKIEANLILQCNRCLEDFVYETEVDVNECYYKDNLFSEYSKDREVKLDTIGEDLNGENEIDIEDLIYQSLILSVPNDCFCDINCDGGNTNLKKYISPNENSN